MNTVKPTEPFGLWPVQWFDERFGFGWYTEPCVFVDQLIHPLGTVEVAKGLHDAIDHVISRKRRAIQEHGGLLIFHDWRRMTGYESEARIAFLDRMRARETGYLRQVVAVLADKPLVKMGVATANIVMALGVGGKLQVATDPWPALREHRIVRPSSDEWP